MPGLLEDAQDAARRLDTAGGIVGERADEEHGGRAIATIGAEPVERAEHALGWWLRVDLQVDADTGILERSGGARPVHARAGLEPKAARTVDDPVPEEAIGRGLAGRERRLERDVQAARAAHERDDERHMEFTISCREVRVSELAARCWVGVPAEAVRDPTLDVTDLVPPSDERPRRSAPGGRRLTS